jgi:hypothetical protein
MPDSYQLKILDPEVCLFQSTAVWHVLLFGPVSRLGEQALQGCEDVLLCTLRGFRVVVSGPFILFLLHNHIITKKKFFLRRCKLRSKFSLFFFASQES